MLLVGFQAPGTRGDALRAGASQLKMFGHYHPVRASVSSVALSAHADQDDLVHWVETCSPLPETVYVNHGEPEASEALVRVLSDTLGLSAIAARAGEKVRLDQRSAR